MGLLSDTVTSQLAEVDAQLLRAKASYDDTVAQLQKRKGTLQAAQALITPELEAAVAGLKRIGLLRDL